MYVCVHMRVHVGETIKIVVISAFCDFITSICLFLVYISLNLLYILLYVLSMFRNLVTIMLQLVIINPIKLDQLCKLLFKVVLEVYPN